MSAAVADIRESLEKLLPEALQFLEELVAINSFTANAAGVDDNAKRIARAFAPLGFQARMVQCTNADAGCHLVLDTGGEGPAIACISHLDTVYSAEEEIRNAFAWQREGDRIFGPGTVDIKGGTALLWMLLSAFAKLEPDKFAQTRWICLWNAAEETLSQDFAELCLEILPPDTRACLVFEGDGQFQEGCTVVRARKGRGVFEIKASGRGAHAGSRHHQGANAIVELARAVEKADRLTDYDAGLTVNVGVIRGGTVVNRVPHEADAILDVRCFDPAVYSKVRTDLLGLSGVGSVKAPSDGTPCSLQVYVRDETPPWPVNPSTDRLIAVWEQAARACGMDLETERRGGLSDGNYLWERFPTLDGLGPRGNNAHASERSADGTKLPEYVDASSFVPKAAINFVALQTLTEA